MKLSARRNNKGFTLIELLVVIGILGILAAALVATIDPFEQLKKGNDSKVKNIAVEFFNSNIRYYTTHNAFPWSDATSGCNAGGSLTSPFQGMNLQNDVNAGEDCLTPLITEGELKQSFDSNPNDLAKITVSDDGNNNLTVCFLPESKSQKNSPETKYDLNGTEVVDGSCPSAVSTTCYWCTK